MKKTIFAILIIIAVFGCALYLIGCSTGESMPSSDIPPMPTGTTGNDLSGTWSGTWASNQPGGNSGMVDPLELSQSDAGDGNYTLSGSMVMLGYQAFEGQTGTVSGTYAPNTVSFTATYGNDYMEFSGSGSGSSMSGIYYIYENGSETDSGTFVFNKEI